MFGDLGAFLRKWALIFVILGAFVGATADHAILVGMVHFFSTLVTGHQNLPKLPTIKKN